MGRDWFGSTGHAIRDAVRNRAATALEVTRSHLERIAAVDGKLQAFVSVWCDAAEARARAIDEQIARGRIPGRWPASQSR